MKKIFTLMALVAALSLPASALTWVTVDPSIAQSNGDLLVFKTIQEAINVVVTSALEEQVPIFIKNGTYNEHLRIGNKNVTPSFKLSLIGESRDGVIIQPTGLVATKTLWTDVTADSMWIDRNYGAALYVNGKSDGTSRFYAENITFKNLINPVATAANAVYLRDIDGFAFKNCKFIANKTVLEYKKQRRSMFYNCYIEGTSGLAKLGGTSMLYKCEMKMTADGGHYLEPEDNLFGEKNGADTVLVAYIARESKLTKGDTVHAGTCYLAYPNAHHSAACYIDTKMDSHIMPVGWKINGNGYANSLCYLAEFNSMNLDGSPANVSARGNGGLQLNSTEVNQFFNLKNVYQMNNIIQGTGFKFPEGTNNFRPDSMVCAPTAPTGVSVSGTTVTWNAVAGAEGYIVYRDGAFAGFAASNTFTSPLAGTNYTVYACNIFGAMSQPSGSSIVDMTQAEMYAELFQKGTSAAVKEVKAEGLNYRFTNGVFSTQSVCDFTVYSLNGRCVKVLNQAQEINLQSMPKGLYLIKAMNGRSSSVVKVVL